MEEVYVATPMHSRNPPDRSTQANRTFMRENRGGG